MKKKATSLKSIFDLDCVFNLSTGCWLSCGEMNIFYRKLVSAVEYKLICKNKKEGNTAS